ncbi:hypothetical protein EMELA_v1c03660 [Mesoplasma melaleucae]|uniref:Uncharacterized protein n=1 Tax=Mesoplasma melaleucae TaxID=81459 RepID=A0A2K8NXL4_9MOLU|nr:hypothetical protein [Mesoplasma melaleucae]ATZ17928.1 hypothetical protein EMELA_v1c03660 [Mesoplasma melaleucae]
MNILHFLLGWISGKPFSRDKKLEITPVAFVLTILTILYCGITSVPIYFITIYLLDQPLAEEANNIIIIKYFMLLIWVLLGIVLLFSYFKFLMSLLKLYASEDKNAKKWKDLIKSSGITLFWILFYLLLAFLLKQVQIQLVNINSNF